MKKVYKVKRRDEYPLYGFKMSHFKVDSIWDEWHPQETYWPLLLTRSLILLCFERHVLSSPGITQGKGAINTLKSPLHLVNDTSDWHRPVSLTLSSFHIRRKWRSLWLFFSTCYNPSRNDRGYIHRGKKLGWVWGWGVCCLKLFTKNMCIASLFFSVIFLAFSLSKTKKFM